MKPMIAALPLLALLTSPAQSQESLEPIRKALDERQATDAIELVEELHQQGRATAETHYLLGLAYQIRLDEVGILSKRRVAGQLRTTLEQALKLQPEHIGAHEELADFFFFAPAIVGGSKRRANEQIESLAKISLRDSYRVRGRHALSSEEYRQAEGHFSRALELDQNDPELWYQRGVARRQLLERDTDAFKDFDHALALGYTDAMVHYQIGRLCVRLENCPERGAEALEQFIALTEGRLRSFGHYRMAQLHEQQDRLSEALVEARKALALEPKLKQAQFLLERVEEKTGAAPL